MLLFLSLRRGKSPMEYKIYQALSIVEPHGQNIAQGRKRLEVRSWKPAKLPLYNLVIVENKNLLLKENDEEDGYVVALVDVHAIHLWQRDEVEAACANNWAEGYYAWELTNIRKINLNIKASTKRKLYPVELPHLIEYLD